MWWQAPAWAGKSALISTFVLDPPAGVRVVAFFITARLGAQDTREAFTEVVLEQLADLLAQDLPPMLTAGTRDAHLLGMLEQAAQACAARGERLILVVDGLDEDRGVTTGPDARSIAALLPHDPPAGMRVVVAGRPDPPIPDDVPGWHRLRDPGIIRALPPSAYAQDIKTLAQQELRRLLRGTPAQQDLLGLLTAARGGLSGPDLAALTGESLWEIEDVLSGVSGRTFTRQVSAWQPGDGPEVYLLGHEELQVTARAYFEGQRLAGYQDRLHAWAQEYRDRGWPVGTPEYLLSGYFQMLTATGDTAPLAACATDAARHERMLDITGGDAAALTEVTITLDLIAAQDDPDLTAALGLARHRDYLADRNAHIPASLPAVWATLGQHIRAEALAASITDPDRQAQALAEVARTLAEAGQHEQAAAMASQAETVARSITDPDRQARALTEVAGALAEAGQHEQAETVARSITDPGWQARALAAVAGALAGAGQHEQAGTVARSITDPGWQARALAAVAGALAGAGQHEQAGTVARSITDPGWQAQVLMVVAGALAKAGQHEQAAAMASRAATVSRSITDPGWQARAVAEVAGALAGAGKYEQAETVARSITDPYEQARALAAVAGALAKAGQHEQAAAMAEPGRATAGPPLHHRPGRAGTGAGGGGRRASRGRPARAGRCGSIPGRHRGPLHHRPVRPGAGAGGGGRGAGQGYDQHEQAAAIAGRAEALARSITEPVLAGAGARLRWPGRWRGVASMSQEPPRWHPQQAETVARSITDPDRQARALGAGGAGALAGAGEQRQQASRDDIPAGRDRGPLHHRPVRAGAGAGGGGRGAGRSRPA